MTEELHCNIHLSKSKPIAVNLVELKLQLTLKKFFASIIKSQITLFGDGVCGW